MSANVLNENSSIINSEDNSGKTKEFGRTLKNSQKPRNIQSYANSSVTPCQLSKTTRVPSTIGNALPLNLKKSNKDSELLNFVKRNFLTKGRKEQKRKKEMRMKELREKKSNKLNHAVSTSNEHSETEKILHEWSTTKDEIKFKNSKFIDELFDKSMESIDKIYKKHTSSLYEMSFNNTMPDRFEESYLNQLISVPTNIENRKLNNFLRYRHRVHSSFNRPFSVRELNKVNGLKDLIGSAKLNFDNENNIKTNKSTVSNFQMDAIDSNDLEKTDKNEPGTQTENCFENLIEENSIKRECIDNPDDFNNKNDTRTIIDNDKCTSTENARMETSSDHNNHLKPSISQEKQLIPLKAIISLVTFIRDNKPGITLTWDVKMSSDNISKLSRYNEFKNSNFQSLIKEYEIYGYKETKENSICKNNKPWQMIGSVENYLPPVKCTLTDFQKGYTYYFSIRIIDTQGCYSDFSEPATAKL